MRLSAANIEMEIRYHHFALNISAKQKDKFFKRIEYMAQVDNDPIWIQRIEFINSIDATEEQQEDMLDGIYMDPVCKYFIDEHPKLINKDTLMLFNTYEYTLPLLFYTVKEFDKKDLWNSVFKATKLKVLSDLFCDTFINVSSQLRI